MKALCLYFQGGKILVYNWGPRGLRVPLTFFFKNFIYLYLNINPLIHPVPTPFLL